MNIFDMAEKTFMVAATNPVSASVKAGGVVLTNPFRKNRKSFRESYGSLRQFAPWVTEIDDVVRVCPACDASFGVETRWHKAGNRKSSLGHAGDLTQETYKLDTFCSEHKSTALKAQNFVLMALDR